MMAKIRFVASSLLDTLSNPSGDSNGINSDLPVRLQKAQSYLCEFFYFSAHTPHGGADGIGDFLRILTEIEGLYLLCDEMKGQIEH